MKTNDQSPQNTSLQNQQLLQDNLSKISQQFQQLLDQNNINQKEFKALNDRIIQIENKPVDYIAKFFEPASVVPIIFTVIGTLGITWFTNYRKRVNDKNETKKLIVYFINENRNVLIALSIQLWDLGENLDNSYTKPIKSCQEFIKLLKSRQINQEILSSSKIFGKQECSKLLKYFFELDNISTNINLLINRRFNTEENGDYSLSSLLNGDFNNSSNNKKKLLNGDIDDARVKLSSMICLSFDILKKFDPKSFDDDFKKNISVTMDDDNFGFKDLIYLFWDGGTYRGKISFPRLDVYKKHFPELQTYLDKDKKKILKSEEFKIGLTH